ncbi:DUF4158 domain-containing protein [Streptomyces noursei]|uniref:DUF4158 domain-containing protein n=1 Tax=Streptomyces noursei TaxID=1971 RepID=UPI0037FE6978
MPVEYLSDDQARYGRYAGERSVQELESFFCLDTEALEIARSKRRSHNRLGWGCSGGRCGCSGRSCPSRPRCRPRCNGRVARARHRRER